MGEPEQAPGPSDPAAQRRAVEAAYRAVSRRELTQSELRAALERRRHGEQAIEAAVAELREAGYLDDAGYARRFADDRRRLDRWGAERIAEDLARRGVARAHVEAALAEAPEDAELEAACGLLAERCAPPRDDRERARALALLLRRGYPSDLAYEAVRRHEQSAAAPRPL